MKNRVAFAEWLGQKLVELNMTQEKLALELGISQTAVSKWIQAKSAPSSKHIPKLASILCVECSEIEKVLYYQTSALPQSKWKLNQKGESVLLISIAFAVWAFCTTDYSTLSTYPLISLFGIVGVTLMVHRFNIWLAPKFAKTKVYRIIDDWVDTLVDEV